MTRTEKRLTIGLVISVGLNLLIVGFIAAMAAGFHHGRGPEFAVDRIAEHLEPEARDALRASVAANKDELRQNFRAIRDAHRQAADTLRAETLDQAALEQAFADARVAQTNMFATMHRIMAETAAEMTYEERQELAKMGHRFIRRMMGGRGHRGGHFGRGPHGPGHDGIGRFGPPPAEQAPEAP